MLKRHNNMTNLCEEVNYNQSNEYNLSFLLSWFIDTFENALPFMVFCESCGKIKIKSRTINVLYVICAFKSEIIPMLDAICAYKSKIRPMLDAMSVYISEIVPMLDAISTYKSKIETMFFSFLFVKLHTLYWAMPKRPYQSEAINLGILQKQICPSHPTG